ncbi:MAG: transporter substrate-binding protein [Rhizobacter sp.]|nr:transporter substrate-binding protein [Rhizobacter sp.]
MPKTTWLRAIAAAIAPAAALLLAVPASADTYPDKPIKLVVPFAPGGGTDIIARQIAARLGPVLGQTVVIDNHPGAATIAGTEFAAHSPADGYTLLQGTASLAITPATHTKVPYVALRDLVPITQTATQAYIVVVNPSSHFKSVAELVAYAKAHPGELTYGSPGVGSGGHLAAELFKSMAHIEMTHVPYKGDSPALVDLISGHINLMFSTISPTVPFLKSGRLRAIAVSTASRVRQLPDVPTVSEAGVTGYEASSWNGILAPTGTPKPILDRLNADIVKVLRAPDMVKAFDDMGAEPVGGTPEAFAEVIRVNTEKWAKVIKDAGIQPDD